MSTSGYNIGMVRSVETIPAKTLSHVIQVTLDLASDADRSVKECMVKLGIPHLGDGKSDAPYEAGLMGQLLELHRLCTVLSRDAHNISASIGGVKTNDAPGGEIR